MHSKPHLAAKAKRNRAMQAAAEAEKAQEAVTAVGQAMGAQPASMPAPLPAAPAQMAPSQPNAYGPPVMPGQAPG